MAAFLFRALLAARLVQTPVPSPESLAALTSRVTRDSGDAPGWMALGRAELQAAGAYHAHAGPPDTLWARDAIGRAERAFGRAAALRPGLGLGDSAATWGVIARADLALLEWEQGDTAAVRAVWTEAPAGTRLPAAVEELAENLLRACPPHAVLFTSNDVVTGAAWLLRFRRGLRPDLLPVPVERYRRDSVFAARVAKDAGLKAPPPRSASTAERIAALAQVRPVCAGADFGAPPGGHGRLDWRIRPLVWVGGKDSALGPTVPAGDFVFAALRYGLEANDPWSRFALDVYRRAARLSPTLCGAFATYGISRKRTGCRT